MTYPGIHLSNDQIKIINLPFEGSTIVEGPAGCGKTTVGTMRFSGLINRGVNLDSILILVPQRVLGTPYYRLFRNLRISGSGSINILTIGGIAKRMIDFFWPYIFEEAGFQKKGGFPVHLTLETSEFIMSQIVDPLIDKGLFESVTLPRNRLYSQILDNLNKSSLVGFSHEEISERLKNAWSGEVIQSRIYEDVQLCASKFRGYCLEHNLLDFSLQIQIFFDLIWKNVEFKNYFKRTYTHLIVDNIEEDTPVSIDFLLECINDLDSAFIIHDWDGGYRRFLGAYPEGVTDVASICQKKYVLSTSFVSSKPIAAFNKLIHNHSGTRSDTQSLKLKEIPLYLQKDRDDKIIIEGDEITKRELIVFKGTKYYPEMLDWVTQEVGKLVYEQHIPPSQIVIMAPYLSDVLQFGLVDRMSQINIPARTHRPSRSLADDPAIVCLLTLAAISHPKWEIIPSGFEFSIALLQAIGGMDLVRAQLLTEIVYRIKRGNIKLTEFSIIKDEIAERIGQDLGSKYEILRFWIDNYQNTTVHKNSDSFDHFISGLFGEVLSQPGFGFHNSVQKAHSASELVESIRKFRTVIQKLNFPMIGKEYYHLVRRGVIASQYIQSWVEVDDESILISPANTFLIRNVPVKVQFWLDIGSRGWYQRLNQPLTQPYVLSRDWPPDRKWTDLDEVKLNQENLILLTNGLLRRCASMLYLCFCDMGEQGNEQRGLLLHTLQKVFRSINGYM